MNAHKGIVIDCSALNHQVHVFITSEDSRGVLKILTESGSRISSTLSSGESLSYSINQNDCPLTITYDAEGCHAEYTVGSDGLIN